jgi:hypothetical protein
VKKAASVARIKRKTKKLLKNKWVKTALISIAVFIVAGIVMFFVPVALMKLIFLFAPAATIPTYKVIFLAVILLDIILFPLYFLDTFKVITKREADRTTNKGRHKKNSQRTNV